MQLLLGRALSEIPAALLAALPIIVVWCVLVVWRARHGSRSRAIAVSTWDAALLFSLEVIVLFTVQPSFEIHPELSRWSFIPFADLIHSLPRSDAVRAVTLRDMGGNIVLFAPWGAALALRFRSMSLTRAVILSVAVSTVIELLQALWPAGHTSDVTDVLMNALGGGIGFLAARLLLGIARDRGARGVRSAVPPVRR